MSKKIGFIGQGWIGKNYADDFENRGHEVIRYALEEPYVNNKEKIKECDIVFIAVPTPTTKDGFNYGIVSDAIKLIGKGKTAVIKSTILPGVTELIQKENPDVYVMHSPEFLTEKTAAFDAANPQRNIVGIPVDTEDYSKRAGEVLGSLPNAPYSLICSSKEAELIKYGGNCWFYVKVVFVNMLYDLVGKMGGDYEKIKEALAADPRIGSSHLSATHDARQDDLKSKLGYGDYHLDPVHKSGRGAGGNCFIKDFAAFAEIYEREVGDKHGLKLLESLADKNIDLLVNSNKDMDLLSGVYGEDRVNSRKSQSL